MLGRAASCCDLLRLSPTPGDSSEDDVYNIYYMYIAYVCFFLFVYTLPGYFSISENMRVYVCLCRCYGTYTCIGFFRVMCVIVGMMFTSFFYINFFLL